MAIYRPSALVQGISGSVGGVEFANTRGGVARKRQQKKSRTGAPSVTARAIYWRAVKAWEALDDDEKNVWNQNARNVYTTNRLGLPRNLKGSELFLQVAIPSLHTDGIFPTEPPEIFGSTSLVEVNFTVLTTAGIEIQCFIQTGEFNLGYVEVQAGWLVNRHQWKNPRTWRLVYGGILTVGPGGGKATINPAPTLNPPLISTVWPDDFPGPMSGWTLITRTRIAGNGIRPTGWIYTRGTVP